MSDEALREQVDEIVDKHRHFCTQADMFTGLSNVQTSHAIMQLIKEARIDELKNIVSPARTNKQKHLGVAYLVEDRLAELSNPTQTKKTK